MNEHIDRLNAALQGRYTIQRELGSGGMATVYLAEDLKHRRQALYAVWGTSSSDVFAVSETAMRHYDGVAWTGMASGGSAGLAGVWGTSSSDVCAVGSGGKILHYDGTEWTEMVSGTDLPLHGVWGSSSSDVFTVGYRGVILRGTR